MRLRKRGPKPGGREDLSRRDFLGLASGAAASLLAGCGFALHRGRPEVLVWSCGGNYDFLLDFNRGFEKLTGCGVTYSSAPVEHLISVLAARARGVDVLVGRSGPGWSDLSQRGRLAGKPQVFALDPYVIIVPPGNPANIRGVADLKRPDVQTAYSPTASGPSGKVVRFLLEAADEVVEAGIYEGYVRNAVEAQDCGWKVFPPVIEGRADAAVTRRSMTTAPETRGKVEIVPIPVKVMAAMKEGHGAIPQRAAAIAGGKNPELAARYVESLRGELGMELCGKHGYIHRLAPEAKSHKPLFKMRAEKGDIGGGQSVPVPGVENTPPSQERSRNP